MIQKKYRLKEREVKKVLAKGKPFFSYNLVLNYSKNKLSYNRFAIVIGGKSVKNNIVRTYFRRRFYDEVIDYIYLSQYPLNNRKYSNLATPLFTNKELEEVGFDLVFVLKKQFKLEKKDDKILDTFKKDIRFLLKKVIK